MDLRRTHARELLAALMISLILTVVVLLAFGSLRQRVQQRLLSSLIELQEQTSLSLSYDHITVDLFDRILLDEVRISEEGKDVPLIQIGSLGASYSLFELLQGPQVVKTLDISLDSLSILTDQAQLERLLDTINYLFTAFPAREDLKLRFTVSEINIDTVIADRQLNAMIPQVSGEFFKGQLDASASIPFEIGYDPFALVSDAAISYSIPEGLGIFDLEYLKLSYGNESIELSVSSRLDSGRLVADLVADHLDATLSFKMGESEVGIKGRSEGLSLREEHLLSSLIPESLSIPEALYTAEVTSIFDLSYDLERGLQSYEIDAEVDSLLLEEGSDPMSLSLVASGDDQQVTISSLQTQIGSLSIDAEGRVRYADPLWPVASIRLSTSEQERLLLVRIDDQSSQPFLSISSSVLPGILRASYDLSDLVLDLDGVYELEGTSYDFVALLDAVNRSGSITVEDSLSSELLLLDGGGLDISANLDRFSLPTAGGPRLSGALEGTFITADDWRATGRSFTIEGLRLSDSELLLQGDLTATETAMSLENLSIFDGQTTYTGSGNVAYAQGVARIGSRAQAEVRLTAGESELYSITASVEDATYLLDLLIDSGRLEHIPLAIGSGRLSGDLSFSGDLYDYNLTGELLLEEGAIGGTEVDGALSVSASQDRVSLQLPMGSYGSFDYADLSIEYDQNSGTFRAGSNLTFELDRRKIITDLEISAQMKPQRIDPGFSLDEILKEGLNATVTLGSIRVNDQEVSPVVIDAALKDDTVRITSSDLSDLSVDYRLGTGAFRAVLNEGLPIRFTMDGTIHDGKIDAYTEDLQANATLFTELGLPFITFADGTLEGRVTVTGPFSDLEYYGELFGSSIEASIPFVPQSLSIDDMYVSLIGKEIVFAPFAIRHGNSSAMASLSLFVDDVMPTSLDLKVDIPKDQPVPFENGFSDIRLYYAGTLAGSLHLYGGFTDFTLEADALADNGFFSQFVSDEKNPRSFSNIRLSLETGKNLQMIFPNKDLPIITATAKEGETISVTADLVRNQYNAVGDITLRGGEIVYFKRNFYIVNGSLDLNISQALIDPKVSVVAKLKDFDADGEKIDIFLTVEDDSVFKLSPVFSSSPSKSLAEISEILGKNIIPSDYARNSDFSTALAVATLATDVIQQVGLIEIDPIGDLELSIRNALKLDLFSIRTQVLQNILLDTLPGDFSTTFTRNPIARYLDNTTVFLGKYITNDMFLQAIIQLSAREGLGGGLFITDDIGLDIEVSYEWDNPLYDLSVSMQPESLAVTDILDSIKLGVSWNITF